ncbi:membrane protein insertase YidC [Prolixibacteraceae bacterium JC049]|nr:membrane protein insertase YidC [Prolixibacteraceae bacterium JC049]
MDRNTLTGIALIFLVLIGFSYLNRPSKEQLEAAKHRKDSIEQVQRQMAIEQQQREAEAAKSPMGAVENNSTATAEEAEKELVDRFGAFAAAAKGEEQFTTLENNLMKVTLSNKGGRIYSVELKGYKRFNGEPLVLFEGDKSDFGMEFFAANRNIATEQLFFVPSTSEAVVKATGPEVRKGDEGKEKVNEENPGQTKNISMKLNAGDGKYIEYRYAIKHNSFMIDFDVNMVGMNDVISSNADFINFKWNVQMPRQEQRSKWGEDRYSTIYYKYDEDEVDKLTTSKSGSESLKTKVKWVDFKQLFFSSTLIADEAFANADVKTIWFDEKDPRSEKYLARYESNIGIPFSYRPSESANMQFYFGPNHYYTLKQYGIDLQNVVNLGYAIVRPVSKYVVIPIFNWLRRFISNFGVIIIILTLIIKFALYPLTYKSYIAQAKMKALKPEIDEINAKYPQEKAMERQQATMALYKKAGVNPMGGCLPMVLQMPILFSMFFFFPTSIELRQQGFLWAHDLSTYDSIISWQQEIPFLSSILGNHISLFTVLMTITSVFYTKVSSANQAGGQQMAGMKTMMYMMPVVFFFVLNNYSSGLSFYYFLANLITIGQTYLSRRFVDEEKIRAQLQANKKKPVKKSKFQQRLEEMAKQKGMQMPK